MSPAVSGRDAEVHLLPGALNHAEHLELGLQVEAVSTLALHQRGPRPHHALQPLLEGAEQLLLRGLACALHREVDPSSSLVDVHVCGSCQLNTQLIVRPSKCREVAGRSTEPTCRGDIQHDSQSMCHDGTSQSERGGGMFAVLSQLSAKVAEMGDVVETSGLRAAAIYHPEPKDFSILITQSTPVCTS